MTSSPSCSLEISLEWWPASENLASVVFRLLEVFLHHFAASASNILAALHRSRLALPEYWQFHQLPSKYHICFSYCMNWILEGVIGPKGQAGQVDLFICRSRVLFVVLLIFGGQIPLSFGLLFIGLVCFILELACFIFELLFWLVQHSTCRHFCFQGHRMLLYLAHYFYRS